MQSCKGTGGQGCGYNKNPVYTGLPCPFARPPLSPPASPPPPSLPPVRIPAAGIAILPGNSPTNVPLFCLFPGDEDVTSSQGRAEWPPPERDQDVIRTYIAAQCCASDRPDAVKGCRRRATADGQGSTSDEDCVAGVYSDASSNTFVKNTYVETVVLCSAMDLVLCSQSCAGEGCKYNLHPVYSGIPCSVDR